MVLVQYDYFLDNPDVMCKVCGLAWRRAVDACAKSGRVGDLSVNVLCKRSCNNWYSRHPVKIDGWNLRSPNSKSSSIHLHFLGSSRSFSTNQGQEMVIPHMLGNCSIL